MKSGPKWQHRIVRGCSGRVRREPGGARQSDTRLGHISSLTDSEASQLSRPCSSLARTVLLVRFDSIVALLQLRRELACSDPLPRSFPLSALLSSVRHFIGKRTMFLFHSFCSLLSDSSACFLTPRSPFVQAPSRSPPCVRFMLATVLPPALKPSNFQTDSPEYSNGCYLMIKLLT